MKSIALSPSRHAAVAVGTTALASAVIVYGAYGDPNPKSEQQAAVPFLIVAVVLVAAFVYGWLVPRSSAPEAEMTKPRTGRPALPASVVALLLVPVVFWSGIPIVVGGAGVLLGSQLRRTQHAAVAGPARSAVVVGALAIASDVVMIVLSNTVL